jgi:hypothetical protein
MAANLTFGFGRQVLGIRIGFGRRVFDGCQLDIWVRSFSFDFRLGFVRAVPGGVDSVLAIRLLHSEYSIWSIYRALPAQVWLRSRDFGARIGFVRAIRGLRWFLHRAATMTSGTFDMADLSSTSCADSGSIGKNRGIPSLGAYLIGRVSVPDMKYWVMPGFLRPLRHQRHGATTRRCPDSCVRCVISVMKQPLGDVRIFASAAS